MLKNWYGVYTKPKLEMVVSKLFNKKKIINYCPLNTLMTKNKSGFVEYQIPLFPNFVFVNIDEQQIEAIKSIQGVINLLFWLGRPVQLRNNEIEQLMAYVKKFKNIRVEKIPVELKSLMLIDKRSLQKSSDFELDSEGIASYALPSLGFCLKAYTDDKKNFTQISDEKIQSEWDIYYSKY